MKVEVQQATADDLAFSFAVTEDAMRCYVEATWGSWDPLQQRQSHSEQFVAATHWVVFVDGVASGIAAVELMETHIQLVKLYLQDGARNKGVGAMVLSAVLKSASDRSLPVRLRVLAANRRAQAFYKRHGFRTIASTNERMYMEVVPNRRRKPKPEGVWRR